MIKIIIISLLLSFILTLVIYFILYSDLKILSKFKNKNANIVDKNLTNNNIKDFLHFNKKEDSKIDEKLQSEIFKTLEEAGTSILNIKPDDRLIIPLEAIVFLNKNLAPLVDEDGNIIVKTSEENTTEAFDAIKLYLQSKEGNEVIASNEDVIKHIQKLQGLKESKNNNKVKIDNNDSKKEDNSNQKENDSQKIADIKDIENTVEESVVTFNPEDEFGDSLLAELDSEILAEELNLLNNSQLDSSIDIEDISNNREDFYNNKRYKQVKDIIPIDFDDLKNSVSSILSGTNTQEALINNLLKTKGLIFSNNKEEIFVSLESLYLAFSKLYSNSNEVLANLKSLKRKAPHSFLQGINDAFDSYITKNTFSFNFKDKDNNCYWNMGLLCDSRIFNISLNETEFNAFRKYPFMIKYILLNEKPDNKCSKLFHSTENMEI